MTSHYLILIESVAMRKYQKQGIIGQPIEYNDSNYKYKYLCNKLKFRKTKGLG